ncbi:CynX/NimT family MFS transporter [Paenibacillus guangzhouensis]|uniref:CynX/NimT family MFS transporter n=1 Tax=Paenibacillus guangzhouensis TaxID=1473112 RepID=UPI0012674937|nr:MFS transporter [Paenibacillus guangzhouensis]
MSSRTRNLTLLFVCILLVAANLRAPITGLGPVVGLIREDTGLSGTVIGLLTTLTLIAFAVISPLVPGLARRFGMELTLIVSLVVLTVGVIVRSLPSAFALFFGTALLGLAIAVGNVLVPTMIKRDFPQKVGLMTGVYSSFMNLWAAVASGLAIPLAEGANLGWRGSLAVWGVLTVIALIAWLPQLRYRQAPQQGGQQAKGSRINLWRSGLAWYVTLFMGVQSFFFYVNITWLPEILHAQGMSTETAGWMMFLLQLVSLPASFLTPIIAARLKSQRVIALSVAAGFGIGYVLLLTGGLFLTVIGTSLIGIAGGAGFSLAVMFFALRTRTVLEAAEMSGMAQSVGYFIAAIGPMLFGLLHDLTQSWTVTYITLFVTVVILAVLGFGAGKNAYVVATSPSSTAEGSLRKKTS